MEEILPILGSERTTFYRNKLEFTFSNKKWLTEEEVKSGATFDCMNGVGFHIPGMFDKVLDIHKCWLQNDISNRIRLYIKEYCLSHEGYPFFDLRNQEGFIRTLMIRTASTGDLMVVVVFYHEDKERQGSPAVSCGRTIPGNHFLIICHKTKSATNDHRSGCWYSVVKTISLKRWKAFSSRLYPKSFYQTNSGTGL